MSRIRFEITLEAAEALARSLQTAADRYQELGGIARGSSFGDEWSSGLYKQARIARELSRIFATAEETDYEAIFIELPEVS